VGLFSKQKKYVPSQEKEAWVAVLYGLMASDGEIADEELDRLVNYCAESKHFEDVDVVEYFKAVGDFARKNGFESVLAEAPKYITDHKQDLIDLLIDMTKADGFVLTEEIETLQEICKQLNIDWAPVEAQL
jgi:tellurite resistance protein